MPFGGSKSKETPKEIQLQGELTALQSQAAQKDEELAKVRESLDSEKLKAEKAEKEALSQKSQAGDYKHQLEEIVNLKAKSDGESQILFKEKAEEFERKERESSQKAEEETSGLRSKLEEAQKTLDKEADEKAAREGHKLKLNEELTETKQALEETKVFLKEKEEAVMTLSGKIGSMQVDKASPIWVLDVAIGECEFASPFAYFLELQLEGHAERRCTDVSQPSTRPVFTNASQLLSTDPSVANHKLKVCAFLNVEDHSGNLVAKLLGTALVSLGDLKVADGSTASKRVSRAIDFLRDSAENTAQGNTLVVGRTTLEMKVKVLLPSEMATMTAASSPYTTPRTQLSAGSPSLDKSLWAVRLFEHRLRVLIHHAGDLPVPEAGRATLRVALRLLQQDGKVIHESVSPSLAITSSAQTSTNGLGEVVFNQEVVLPLLMASSDEQALKISLALEMVSTSDELPPTLSSLLDLKWSPAVLPLLHPFHLCARTSSKSQASSSSRPRPSLLVSIVREPHHEALDGLGDGASQAVEIRVHGVPDGRALPDLVEDIVVAVCPETSPADLEAADMQIPVATYYYDQRIELSEFMEAEFRSAAKRGIKYFLTPVVGPSRTPNWGQFVLRCLSSKASLRSLPLLLFEKWGRQKDAAHVDFPLGGKLLAFATLDTSSLLKTTGSDPMTRDFLLDLRMLEAPGACSSLQVEARVWPRGDGSSASTQPSAVAIAPDMQPEVSPRQAPPSAATTVASAEGGVTAALGQEANEFRLNHELSVQLAKEFNLRAAALKRAGEEIVVLRRQIQLLRNENHSLKAQIEDEEQLAQDVRLRPPPEGLESLSSAELAAKLQRTLERYREEKVRGAELARRLEDSLKEASRGRGLERSLEELQQAHLEQNRELQRLQDEGRKLETYRQTTKTQEKVITKLENILESSLQEVQKAQKVQVNVERLKTENLRLRERCSGLLAKSKKLDGGDEEEIRRKLSQKDVEIARLQGLVKELRGSNAPPQELSRPQADGAEQQRLQDLESHLQDWEQKCQAAEHRLQMLQRQLTESSRRYGAEITDLKVTIAKRDARIMELEYLLDQRDGGEG